MFGLFNLPGCPYCGGQLTRTGYSFPYAQLRCVSCINRNNLLKKQKETLRKIADKLDELNKS